MGRGIAEQEDPGPIHGREGRIEVREVVDDSRDRGGARLKFSFRTRSAGLRAEVGYWKNREESRECVVCSEGEYESVEHVMMRCEA